MLEYRIRKKVYATLLVAILVQTVTVELVGTVFAVQDDLHSAGVNWEWSQYTLESSDLKMTDVEFANSTHGWIVGEDRSGVYGGIVIGTIDGGESWELQMNNTSPYHERIDIIDNQIIWITGKGSLFYSMDGGENWNESVVVIEESGMSFVTFINRTHGWTATMGTLFGTVDSGLSWQTVDGWSFNGDVPRDMHFVSTMDAWAIGFFGIYYSSDGGETWSQNHDVGGRALSFVDDLEAWAVADNMLAHMIDGQTWIERPPPMRSPLISTPPYFSDVLFLDSDNGWIVGGITDDVHILYTPNGGQDWYEQSTSTQIITRLYSVDFINRTHGWAVGSDGTIIYTKHGNSLGTRLWNGSTDPLFLIIVGTSIAALVTTIGISIIWKKKRTRVPQ